MAWLTPASYFLLLVQKESNQRKAHPPGLPNERFFRDEATKKVPKLI
jgi:hypothetical protein